MLSDAPYMLSDESEEIGRCKVTDVADEREPRRWDVVPVLVLAAIVGLMVLGWLAYPALQRALSTQDCIATGRTNCS
jgi:hypothetical protein